MSVPGANTLVDVFRDADADAPAVDRDVDAWGDDVDTPRDDVPGGSTDEPFLSGVVAAIFVQQERVPVDGDLRTVLTVSGRVEPGTDVRRGDRLVDSDGAAYSVNYATEPKLGPNRPLYVHLDLTRVS